MIEAKFRAWDKTRKKMFDVLCIDLDAEFGGVWKWGKAYHDHDTGEHEADKDFIGWEHIELRQFIGYKDKHGKEIYEGDILQDLFGVRQEVVSFVDPVHLLSGWMLKPIREPDVPAGGYSVTYTSWLQVGEIIGNIYEHPELRQK